MKDSSREFSPLTLIAIVVVLGLTVLVLELTNRFYYDPICKRHAESHQLTFQKSSMGWRKRLEDWPAECFFRDKRGNLTRIKISEIPLTSLDWLRRILSWLAMVGGVGGSVWLASVISGHKVRRRGRKYRIHDS
jgi:hypothetical protein